MTAIPKKLVLDAHGSPREVIIAWSDYQDLAERMGWDLSEEDAAVIKNAQADWKKGRHDDFVSLSDLK